MLLIKNADLYTPASAGRADLVLAGGHIVRIEPDIRIPDAYTFKWEMSLGGGPWTLISEGTSTRVK
jgi:hypothetical protein